MVRPVLRWAVGRLIPLVLTASWAGASSPGLQVSTESSGGSRQGHAAAEPRHHQSGSGGLHRGRVCVATCVCIFEKHRSLWIAPFIHEIPMFLVFLCDTRRPEAPDGGPWSSDTPGFREWVTHLILRSWVALCPDRRSLASGGKWGVLSKLLSPLVVISLDSKMEVF